MASATSDSPNVQHSVSVRGARNLANTTKTRAQIYGVTPRWLLQVLPWVSVEAGTYRVNRRKLLVPEEAGVVLPRPEGRPQLTARALRHVSFLREADEALLERMARRFVQKSFPRGEAVLADAKTGEELFIIISGKVEVTRTNDYGDDVRVALLREGDYFDLLNQDATGRVVSAQALTPTEVFVLEKGPFEELANEAPEFRSLFQRGGPPSHPKAHVNEYGEIDFPTVTGRNGKGTPVPESYTDYDDSPREYGLTAIESIVQIRTLVADLYNNPYDQLREQMRHAVESIKERQEWELINNCEFGLLHNAARPMRVASRTGIPTPDEFDELLSRVWKKPAIFVAHPRAIAAFGRECTSRGVPPPTVNLFGSPFLTWRGVPIVPCDKLLVDGRSKSRYGGGTTNILLMRLGEKDQGVVGLHQPGIPSEHLPSLSVRFMGIDHNSIASYLVSQYTSAAVLVPDSLGVLENVEVGYYHDKH